MKKKDKGKQDPELPKGNGRRPEREASESKETPAAERKAEKPRDAAAEGRSPDLDQLGELPRSYGSDTIFLVAQEPHWLFTYWDIDISRHPGGQTFLRVYHGDEIEAEIEVPFETRNWYVPVHNAAANYAVEIGYQRGGAWKAIARSTTIQTPPDRLSESERFDFATIPLHLSFHKLMESVQGAIRSGETLLQALSRLQKDGKLFGVRDSMLAQISADQRMILESLFGADAMEQLSSGAFSSEEIEGRVRKLLEEKLSSAGASEALSSMNWSSPESSLFSALSAIAALSSGQLSNLSSAGLSSWVAALSSWASAGGVPSSSWTAESLASWGAESSWNVSSLFSWLQAAQSSWLQAAESSWLQSVQSSWFQAGQSSWAQGALSSESWTSAAMSSWGGSEQLSSFGFAQPRAFHMHVNAEVIFYGGTDPRARVTVAGKPIALNPDGSFRYHFIFPDGTYEIPVVATSPDGVESRSAVLRFERGTTRKGEVGETPQPPLDKPLGAGS